MKQLNKLLPFLLLLGFSLNQKAVAQTATFSQSYTNGATATSQCTAWNTFVSSLSSSGNYVKMTIKGSYDATGISCTDKTIISAFVSAIKSYGTYISGTTSGHVWSICNRYSGEIWIDPPSSCSGSNCPSPGYIIRPCITNLNWGGVNTATCGAPSQTMTLIFEMPTKPNDAGISDIVPPLCDPKVVVTYNNHGTNKLDSAKINWSVNGTLQTQNKYTTPIAQGGSPVKITLTPTYNFVDGSTYTVKAWTSLPNNSVDSVPGNDTFKVTFKYVAPPGTPVTTDYIRCGIGKAPLQAKPFNPGDSLTWFDKATGGNVVGRGKNTMSPFLNLGINTFWVEAAKAGSNTIVANTFAGTTIVSGSTGTNVAWMDVKTNSSGVAIDSLLIGLYQNNPTSTTYELYYKTGTFTGFETTSTAWTLLKTGSVRVTSGTSFYGNIGYIRTGEIILSANTQYAFHLAITGNDILLTNGAIQGTSTDVTMVGGSCGQGVFGSTGVYRTWTQDMKIYYRPFNCPGGTRVPLKITVKPSPAGGAFVKGTPFTSPQPNTTGSIANPDIVAAKDVLTYEITPPTGYSNSGHSTTWNTSNLKITTKSGRVLPSTYLSYVQPTSSNAGKITFTADSTLTDTSLILTISLSDLGPHFCDSTLTRHIFVAPRPVPDFKFNSPICNGDNVLFDNFSKISSGGIAYKWDFGTTNPADTSTAFNVVFKFPTHGTYDVTLSARSLPYGYIVSKTVKVVVTEIPNISFKVFNACLGDSLTLSNATTISVGAITYKWNLGNGNTSTKVSPKVKYTNAGSYTVTLTASASGCNSTLSKKAHQFVRPIANFTTTGNCSKAEIVIRNLTTIGLQDNFGSTWTFGDGTGNNDNNPTHIYNTAGNKTIKYVATSQFGCRDSMTKTIAILASPEASFTNGPVCNVKPVIFNNTSVEPAGVSTNYFWEFGDGKTSLTKNPQHNYPDLGKRNIRLTAKGNNGCETMVEKSVTVLSQPTANFDALDACLDDNAIFTNKTLGSGVINYKWKFGDGDSSSLFSPVKKYTSSGAQTYNVTLTASIVGGCSDAIVKAVNMKENPNCGFTAVSAGTGGFEYKFTPTVATYPFYQWSFEGGGISNSASPVHKFAYDGVYKVRVFMKTADGCDCVDSSQSVSVNHLGVNSIETNAGIAYYPNPNNGSFTIQVSSISPVEAFSLNIIDLTGRVLHTNRLVGNSRHEVSYPELANGMYTIEVVKDSGERSTSKMNVIK